MPKNTNSNNSSSNKIGSPLANEKPINVASYNEEESINFFELIILIWEKKFFIILITIIFSTLSYFYAFQLKNIYRVEAYLLPPKDTINANGKRSYRSSFENIYSKYKTNLRSRKMQKEFLIATGRYEKPQHKSSNKSMDKEFFEGFFSALTIEEKKSQKLISVSNESNDPIFYTNAINDYIDFVNKETVKIQIEIAQKRVDELIADIQNTIASKRTMAKQRREDQITRFKEASIVAEILGFKRRVDAKNIIQSTAKMAKDFTAATTPLYYIGAKALQAEIQTLENRNSDDPFISGLRDLQEDLAFLKSLDLGKENINAVLIDQYAYPSKTPIRPNRKFIILIGIFTGLTSGILIATLFSFFKKQFYIFSTEKKN